MITYNEGCGVRCQVVYKNPSLGVKVAITLRSKLPSLVVDIVAVVIVVL